MKIVLPFPSSLLSGHAKGNDQWLKVKTTKAHREWARLATLEARGGQRSAEDGQAAQESGDIAITIRFIPPNNRGDRMNYPARMKPYVDGIADALGVNDRRFHPCFIFCEPEKPGRVEVYVGGKNGNFILSTAPDSGEGLSQPVKGKLARAEATNKRSGQHRNAFVERSI